MLLKPWSDPFNYLPRHMTPICERSKRLLIYSLASQKEPTTTTSPLTNYFLLRDNSSISWTRIFHSHFLYTPDLMKSWIEVSHTHTTDTYKPFFRHHKHEKIDDPPRRVPSSPSLRVRTIIHWCCNQTISQIGSTRYKPYLNLGVYTTHKNIF